MIRSARALIPGLNDIDTVTVVSLLHFIASSDVLGVRRFLVIRFVVSASIFTVSTTVFINASYARFLNERLWVRMALHTTQYLLPRETGQDLHAKEIHISQKLGRPKFLNMA